MLYAKKWWAVPLVVLQMLAHQSAWSQGIAREALGSDVLPVYRMDYGNPKHWVQRNAVRLIDRAANFDTIEGRVVGNLSTACVLGNFNQRRDRRFFIVAKTDKANTHLPAQRVVVLGYAHGRGVNLHDPKGLADGEQSYLFRYDRTGKCQVFLGK